VWGVGCGITLSPLLIPYYLALYSSLLALRSSLSAIPKKAPYKALVRFAYRPGVFAFTFAQKAGKGQ
jgi:hypothetical protein